MGRQGAKYTHRQGAKTGKGQSTHTHSLLLPITTLHTWLVILQSDAIILINWVCFSWRLVERVSSFNIIIILTVSSFFLFSNISMAQAKQIVGMLTPAIVQTALWWECPSVWREKLPLPAAIIHQVVSRETRIILRILPPSWALLQAEPCAVCYGC